MIVHLLEQINALVIVLASQSPRRKELLENLGIQFTCVPSNFEENLDKVCLLNMIRYDYLHD
jgi:hypothetical protein